MFSTTGSFIALTYVCYVYVTIINGCYGALQTVFFTRLTALVQPL